MQDAIDEWDDMTIPALRGLRHLALNVTDIRSSRAFYEGVFGMRVVWEPDETSVYLSSGVDNLALHQIPADERGAYQLEHRQRLDHFGFLVDSPESVDAWFHRIQQEGIPIVKPPKQHRDGSYSFYLRDPDRNIIQVLFEPHVSPRV